MNYSSMIASFHGISCVLAYDMACGDPDNAITIAAANDRYLASVNRANEDFVPGRPYTYYVPYDPNFEALVKNCITNGKISHQYVNAELYKAWLDLYMIPLEPAGDNRGYCLFTYEMNSSSDSDKMIDISAKTAYMVLKTCIKFRESADFVGTMHSIVCDIRNQCESDGCAVILTDWEKRKIDHCWFDRSGDGIFAPEEDDIFFKPEFFAIVEGWSDLMGGTNCFIIPQREDLKAVKAKDPVWYDSLVSSGVNSLVLYPLRTGNDLYGYIFATNFNSDKTSFIREIMELNSFVLSAEAENYRMRQKLETMSTTDMLTGVLNRNAMNKRVEELEKNTKGSLNGLGVVFCDLNGLKMANDSKGHSEGDELLKKVARILCSVYEGEEIYRAGGDEFLIMINDMDKDDFDSRLEKLNSISSKEDTPPFALGAHYEEKGGDINAIMQAADEKMYRNKAEYYADHPKMNRRIKTEDTFSHNSTHP
ncbi:MAG: GGDEF domain-containing protein [Lachnospiraceae bacterium]|nr:GGDEF domain-containing protein [Lachnospiraceae bacterium]